MFILTDQPLQKVNYITTLVVFAGPPKILSVLAKEENNKLFLPACPIQDNETSIESAAKLLFDLTGVSARTGPGTTGYEDLILSGIHDYPLNKIKEERAIYLIYSILLPKQTNGTWVQLNDSRLDSNMLSLIYEMGRKI